jgi:hypothetical protein
LETGARIFLANTPKAAFFIAFVSTLIDTTAMNQPTTPQKLLQQIAQINQLEPGKLCVIRQGPDGPYYKLQSRQNGKNLTRYVPRDQAPLVATHTANYERFQSLIATYVALVANQTRAEREAGFKKKTLLPRSSRPKTRKSKS